jgi:hypothetical protein
MNEQFTHSQPSGFSRFRDSLASLTGLGKKSASQELRMALTDLKLAFLDAAQDCPRNAALDRLRIKASAAHDGMALWLLRTDLYAVISAAHGENTAAQRINRLLETFIGWVPEKQRRPI